MYYNAITFHQIRPKQLHYTGGMSRVATVKRLLWKGAADINCMFLFHKLM